MIFACCHPLLPQEAQTARQGLEVQSEMLANQIADAILSRRAA